MTIKISKEDSELFRNTIGNITPISQDGVKPESHVKSQKSPPVRQATVHIPVNTDNIKAPKKKYTSTEKVEYCKAGLQKNIFKKLKQGKFPINDRIDLHGMVAKEADKALTLFIDLCSQNNAYVVLIIHGKSRNLENRYPVLKNQSIAWLKNCSDVLAISSALPKDGGTGAIYAMLKRIRPPL